jgi:hypothetical protein
LIRAPSVGTKHLCVFMFKSSHCPDGKIADVLAPTHVCTTANASTTVGECCRDLEKFPSPPWETHHCLLSAGRRCLCRFWLSGTGHDNVFLDLWEYSYNCARSCSKVPIAPMGRCPIPMGDSHVACCLQGGGVYIDHSGRVTITSSSIYGNTANVVRAHIYNFPSPRWENG